MSQPPIVPYLLSDLSQLSDISQELPVPSLKVPLNTYLMVDEHSREVAKNALLHPTDQLVTEIGQLLRAANTDYLQLNPVEAVGPRSPMTGSPLLTKLLQQYPESFSKTVAQQPRVMPATEMPQVNSARVPLVNPVAPTAPNGSVAPVAARQQFAGKENKVNAQVEAVQADTQTVKPEDAPKLPAKRRTTKKTEPKVEDEHYDPLQHFERFLEVIKKWEERTKVVVKKSISHKKKVNTEEDSDEESEVEEESPAEDNQEPLSNILLSELCSEVVRLKNQRLLLTISPPDLNSSLNIMHKQVLQAKQINLKHISEEEAFSKKGVLTVMSGLEASLVILNIITTDEIPKALVMEEAIEDCLALCRSQLKNYIFPAFDPTLDEEPEEVEKEIAKEDEINEEEDEDPEALEPSEVKPVSALKALSDDKKKPKKVPRSKNYTHSSAMVHKIVEILSKLNDLISRETLPDTIILEVISITLPTFFVEGIHSIQLAALNVVRSVFSRYETHRNNILEDIFHSLVKLPKTKRNLRNYKLYDQKKSIQMVSALVLQLIQCCTALPKQHNDEKSESDDEDKVIHSNNMWQLHNCSQVQQKKASPNSYTAAIKCANTFLGSFIKNCTKQNKENDYRPILQNMVEDLLITLNMPEWPAAEVLLQLLCKSLIGALLNKQTTAANAGSNDELRLLSIQLLGMIASRIRQDARIAKESVIFKAPPKRMLDTDEIIEENEDSSCICGTGYGNRFMIDCDDCHRWFHGECIGVNAGTPPPNWLCDQCVVRRKLDNGHTGAQAESENNAPNVTSKKPVLLSPKMKKTKKRTNIDLDDGGNDIDLPEDYGTTINQDNAMEDVGDTPVDNSTDDALKTNVSKELILNYLAYHSMNEPSFKYARQFVLSQWNYEDDDENNTEFYRSEWDINAEKMKEVVAAPRLSPNGTMKMLLYLALMKPLLSSFDGLMGCVLGALGDQQTKFRLRALKALASVIESDLGILGEPKVQAAVRSRFWDQSISVREAAVDLVGKFIVERPEYADQYYEIILERMVDTGVSVRKRVVKICKTICLARPTAELSTNICKKLVGRINDEESIRSLVLGTFKELWFEETKGQNDILSAASLTDKPVFTLQQRTQQILDVIEASDANHYSWFEELVQGLLKQEQEKKSAKISLMCTKFCDYLSEVLLQLTEVAAQESKNAQTKQKPTRLIICLITMGLFCKVSPEFMLKHAENLETYLKNKKDDEKIHCEVAAILERVLPLMQHPDPAFIKATLQDLVDLLHAHTMPVIQSCSKCLCSIVKKYGDDPAITAIPKNLYNTYFKPLSDYKERDKPPTVPRNQQVLIRSLFLLGSLCRYYDFDDDVSKNNLVKTAKKDIKYGTHLEGLYSMCLAYSKNSDLNIKSVAIRSLGFIFTSYPGLLLRSELIIKESLSANAPDKLKVQMLLTLNEYLDYEEAKMAALGEKQSKQTTKEKDEIKENADYGVTSVTMQKLLSSVLEHLFDKNLFVRSSALALIDHILRRGLVLPLLCVPKLVALETDHEISLSEKAHRVLRLIENKDAQMINNRISDGILGSFEFQKKVYGTVRAYVQTKWNGKSSRESIFARVYSLFKGSKTGRQYFLNAIIGLIEKHKTNIALVEYLVLAVAQLPFSLQEEPLYLIYNINHVVSLNSAELLTSLKAAYTRESLSSEEKKQLVEETKATVSIGCLMKLKKFLKTFYSLADNKCQAFSPSDSKLGSLNNKIAIETCDVQTSINLNDIVLEGIEKDAQVQKAVFERFKKIVKEDEHDHNLTVTTSKKGKRKAKEITQDPDASFEGEKKKPAPKRRRVNAKAQTAKNEDDDFSP